MTQGCRAAVGTSILVLFAAAAASAPASDPPRQAEPAAEGAPEPTRRIPIHAPDDHGFYADFYAPPRAASYTGILVIPSVGRDRKFDARFAAGLARRGYAVLIMDNLGNQRNITTNANGVPMYMANRMQLLDQLLLDVRPAGEVLRQLPGVDPQRIGIVGIGIGGNVGLIYASQTDEVAAIAFVLPGFGCEQYDSNELIAKLGRRRALLVHSQRPRYSDFTTAFNAHATGANADVRERLEVPRVAAHDDDDAFTARPELDRVVFEWLDRSLPVRPAR